jgi:hypothetical protein
LFNQTHLKIQISSIYPNGNKSQVSQGPIAYIERLFKLLLWIKRLIVRFCVYSRKYYVSELLNPWLTLKISFSQFLNPSALWFFLLNFCFSSKIFSNLFLTKQITHNYVFLFCYFVCIFLHALLFLVVVTILFTFDENSQNSNSILIVEKNLFEKLFSKIKTFSLL